MITTWTARLHTALMMESESSQNEDS